ncbi:MAG TPA: hypothetical protein VGQ83_19575 [Polyangia bacterium]|jgi:hypothetical protein
MPFHYYQRLSAPEQAIYRRSDELHVVKLPNYLALRPIVPELGAALEQGDRRLVQVLAARLVDGITAGFDLPGTTVEVLEIRPKDRRAELHGLYTVSADGRARISVWMRTAEHGRVVAFRTFLRTLLHEVCHHLDVALLDLAPSFHTAGFYRRESSLFHQLVPEAARAYARAPYLRRSPAS